MTFIQTRLLRQRFAERNYEMTAEPYFQTTVLTLFDMHFMSSF